jgi:hypothetical protein
LSTTAYRTISIWFYISANPTEAIVNVITNNNINNNWDGAYIQLTGAGQLHFCTNAGTQFPNLRPAYMPLNKWSMITFSYIISGSQPSYCYLDGELVGQFVHGNDSVDTVQEQRVRISAASAYGGRWGEVKVWNIGLSVDQVRDEYINTKSYYGV